MAVDPLSVALDIGGKVIARLWPDPLDQAKAQIALLELAQRGDLAQIAVNQAEASSSSAFTSSWRPLIGYICGAGCAWNWLGLPIASFVMAALGHPVAMAPADLGEMMPLLFGLLGMSGLRTLEKVKGVAA